MCETPRQVDTICVKVISYVCKKGEEIMQSTKKKMTIAEDGMIEAHGRRYSPEYYDRFKKYQQDYQKKKYRQFLIRARYDEDGDVIEHMSKQESLNAYIFNLIRKDMKRKGSK